MKRDAIITFDYEVFLGRETGTLENCVIKPTRLVLQTLKENYAKAIFFVDATWLLFLKENFHDDFQLIVGQLKEIIESGSSIELHLHPQWIDAYKNGNKIGFNSYRHYNLHSLNKNEVLDLFAKSVELLENITNRKVHCFRAGGWCIEPFNHIMTAFESAGIVYDFSVIPGLVLNEGKGYDFDFSRAPKLPFYKFQNDINQPEVIGSFVEFPLSTFYTNPLYIILNKVLLKLKKDHIFGDGVGAKEKSVGRAIFQVFRLSKTKMSLDKTSNILFKYLLGTHFRSSPLIVIVSHPKMISNEALSNLKYITEKFNTLNSSELNVCLPN